MIPVAPAPEPPTFDADVRRPGLRAIAERVGERPPRAHGRRHARIAASREGIPAHAFPPYWQSALDDLLSSYRRVCSYLCFYIPRGSGAPSVDHMIPKSVRWDQVYEWRNCRLACSLMNSRKGVVGDVLDPFEIGDDWFALELVDFQVVAGAELPAVDAAAVEQTIERLSLNDLACCEERGEFAGNYWQRHVSLDYLTRHAPFVARELRRQGRLLNGDD